MRERDMVRIKKKNETICLFNFLNEEIVASFSCKREKAISKIVYYETVVDGVTKR